MMVSDFSWMVATDAISWRNIEASDRQILARTKICSIRINADISKFNVSSIHGRYHEVEIYLVLKKVVNYTGKQPRR
jgi:hypothetical protein